MEGDGYSESMSYAGYNHSNSLTRDENLNRKLLDKLKPVPKNSLRQPVVEKILNQMVNVVNAVMEKYGKPDEIRIELARELKQSRVERNETDKAMSKRQRENEEISKRLSEYNLRATRNNIIKWRLYEEINNEDKRLNAMCIYCGQPISLIQAISGDDVDIEHIIPKSKLFDDSQSNKTLAHRHCNKDKGDRTAYDFMKSKSEQDLQSYIERINTLYVNKIIGKTKRDKLLMTENKIPDNFIDRQLRESQYISRKAREMLQSVCHNVWATSGPVTSELRHLWGWDEITMKLQIPKYRKLGLTENEEWENDNGKHKQTKEVIKGWGKRDDHRQHAIDALTIACTKQGYIQRFNTLNAGRTREKMLYDIQGSNIEFKEKLSLLDKYIVSQKPLQVNEVTKSVANILVSFKAGKKVAVYGTRKIGKKGNKKVIQSRIIVPRGALSEESVYGKIKTTEKKKVQYLFETPSLIIKPHIKKLVEERLLQNGGEVKKAITSLKKEPIFLDSDNNIKLEYATCYKEEYVIKYNVDVNFNKTDKVIDPTVKKILQDRLEKFGGKSKEAFRDVQGADGKLIKWDQDEGLSRPIRSVRCFTGLSAVVPVKKDLKGNDIGFVKPGNNHHIAIYSDSEDNKVEHICTFWHAVERKKHGIPVIIKNSNQIWDNISSNPDGIYSNDFLEKLPLPNLEILLSMQQNEMFVLGMADEELRTAIDEKDYETISNNLYRVQKLAEKYYVMRHHLETQIVDDTDALISKRFISIRSLSSLFSYNPVKVKVDLLGGIIITK
jgi:CRISPR-associated endonuclease Csn1